MLPNIHHVTELVNDRYYVTLRLPVFRGDGYIHVTSTVEADGTLKTGDIMVHTPSGAFVAKNYSMEVLD